MTKYLIAGDFHGNHIWAKKVIDEAIKRNINKIIQVGDFGIWPGKEGQEYLYILNRYLVKHDVKLYFLPGNHEDWNQLDLWSQEGPITDEGFIHILDNIYYTNKINMWIWEGKKFGVIGGAVSIDKNLRIPQISWWPQENLSAMEMSGIVNMSRKIDYLFTHDAPSNIPFDWLIPHKESEQHRKLFDIIGYLYQPKKWFHGHYHMYQEYTFKHSGGYTNVYSLDADDRACSHYSKAMFNHAVILNADTGEVARI